MIRRGLLLLALSGGPAYAGVECGALGLGIGASWTSADAFSGFGPLVTGSEDCGPGRSDARLGFHGAATWTKLEDEAVARYLIVDANAIYYVAMPDEDHPGLYVTGGVSGTRYSSNGFPGKSGAVEYFAGVNAGFALLFGSFAHQAPVRLEFAYRNFSHGEPGEFLTVSLGFIF